MTGMTIRSWLSLILWKDRLSIVCFLLNKCQCNGGQDLITDIRLGHFSITAHDISNIKNRKMHVLKSKSITT